MNDTTTPEPGPAMEMPPQYRLYAAMAKARGEFPVITKNRKVTVTPRDPGKRPYTFAYADLEAILTAVVPALSKHGLVLFQRIVKREDGSEAIETVLAHEGGGLIANHVKMIVMGEGAHAYASATSYASRYGVKLMLVIAAEEDDDGNAGEGNEVERDDEPLNRGTARRSSMAVDAEIIDSYAERIAALVDQADPGGALVLYNELNQPEKDAIWKHPLLTIKVKGAVRKASRTAADQP